MINKKACQLLRDFQYSTVSILSEAEKESELSFVFV